MFKSHRAVPPAGTSSSHSSTNESRSIGSATASSGTLMLTQSSSGPDPLPYVMASAAPPADTMTLTFCAVTKVTLSSKSW